MNELTLVESKTLRTDYIGQTDEMEKVKALMLLPNNLYATMDMVADYFEVDYDALKKVVQRNKDELLSNGLDDCTGDDLKRFVGDNLSHAKTRRMYLFRRRTILNIAMLLRDSDVAREIRKTLLNISEDEAVIRHAISNGLIGGVYSKEYKQAPNAYIEELLRKISVLGGKEAYQLANMIYDCGLETATRRRKK